MAIFHLSISNISRNKGASSCATLAYITGKKVSDERTGNTYSYGRKERVLTVGTILPPSAPSEYANAEKLFNAVELHETADNARTAKKIQVALPKELELIEQKTIIEDYIRNNLTKKGYCAVYAIHDGNEKKNKNGGNAHAHILVTNRPINAKGDWGVKSRKEYALDTNGERIPILTKDGQQKTDSRGRKQWKRINVEQNPLDTKNFLLHLRKEWAAEVNRHLAPEQQIDHRSNAARGIEDTPTIHEGYAARAIEERGEVSERCQTNREIRAENEQRREIRAEIAAAIAEDRVLEKKERELHERLRNVGRGIDDSQTGGTAKREQPTESQGTNIRTTTQDHTATGTRDYTSELLAHRREETERELIRISKERKEAERRQREIEENNRRLRDELEAERQRNSRTPTSDRDNNRTNKGYR